MRLHCHLKVIFIEIFVTIYVALVVMKRLFHILFECRNYTDTRGILINEIVHITNFKVIKIFMVMKSYPNIIPNFMNFLRSLISLHHAIMPQVAYKISCIE